jgi:hypothetical protein
VDRWDPIWSAESPSEHQAIPISDEIAPIGVPVSQNERMPLYRYSSTDIVPVVRTTLAKESIREREDLQRLLLTRIDVIGDDLLVIAEEYSLFQDSRRRVDMLAVDRNGSLVVIELKRTDDGGHMELQALRYAAMVSTITLDHLADVYADAQAISASEAREAIVDWIDEAVDELPNHVRIILVSADFSAEITSTVLWLNENYGTDISCFRIVAYRLESEVLLDVQQIIPLPEAKDFQIHQRQKGVAAAATASRPSGRDFTPYDIRVGNEVFEKLSKQSAIKLAIQKLHSAGLPLEVIRSATKAKRWAAVQPYEGETLIEAFVRERPGVSTSQRWFDLEITEQDTAWVIPRLGGTETEGILSALAAAATPTIEFSWSQAQSSAADA